MSDEKSVEKSLEEAMEVGNEIFVKLEDCGLEWWVEGSLLSLPIKEECPDDSTYTTQYNLFSDLDLGTNIQLNGFQNWMEEPMDMPEVEYERGHTIQPQPPDTEKLIMEFDAVLRSTLTPPDSPDKALPSIIQELSTSNELDELVASRVEEELSSSGGSSFGDSSPRADPDWSPSGTEGGESGCEEYTGVVRRAKGSGRKGRAGGAGVQDKKQRKKEQNRDAATRYRLKKKKEAEGILGEEKLLQDKNAELKLKLGDLTKEVSLLKSLMREVYNRQKGLIK